MKRCNVCGRELREADYSVEPPRPWCASTGGSYCRDYVRDESLRVGMSEVDFVTMVRAALREEEKR